MSPRTRPQSQIQALLWLHDHVLSPTPALLTGRVFTAKTLALMEAEGLVYPVMATVCDGDGWAGIHERWRPAFMPTGKGRVLAAGLARKMRGP